MDIEQHFAAEVFNATRDAKRSTRQGFLQTTADVIEGALIDLWACARALGHSPADIQAMADRHVLYSHGKPEQVGAAGVVPLRP